MGLLERSLDRVFEVSGIPEDGADEHHDEQSQDDGEVGPEQALALLHGPATSEEGDEDNQGGDDDHDVGGGRVEGEFGDDVVTGGISIFAQVMGVIEDVKEGGLVHQYPDPAAQDGDAESENEEVGDEQKVFAH